MGKKSDQIEREIELHRQRLSHRREEIQERVRGDIHDARMGIQDEISSRTKLNEYVDRRPMATMAAAFGTGVLLGAVSEGTGSSKNGRHNERAERREQRQSAGAGFLSGMLGTFTGPLGNTVQDELRDTIRDFFGRGGSGSHRDTGGDDDRDGYRDERQSGGRRLFGEPRGGYEDFDRYAEPSRERVQQRKLDGM